MRFMSFLMTLVLAGSALAQEKSASAIPFAEILKCVGVRLARPTLRAQSWPDCCAKESVRACA